MKTGLFLFGVVPVGLYLLGSRGEQKSIYSDTLIPLEREMHSFKLCKFLSILVVGIVISVFVQSSALAQSPAGKPLNACPDFGKFVWGEINEVSFIWGNKFPRTYPRICEQNTDNCFDLPSSLHKEQLTNAFVAGIRDRILPYVTHDKDCQVPDVVVEPSGKYFLKTKGALTVVAKLEFINPKFPPGNVKIGEKEDYIAILSYKYFLPKTDSIYKDEVSEEAVLEAMPARQKLYITLSEDTEKIQERINRFISLVGYDQQLDSARQICIASHDTKESLVRPQVNMIKRPALKIGDPKF